MIAKNLLVNGSSKFLNKAYFQDVQIGGTATLSSLSLSGNLSVAGTSTLTGNTTVGGTLGVTGAATFSGTVTTNGSTHFRAVEIYDTTPYIDFHYNNSTADYTSRIIETSSGTLHIDRNLTITSTISAPTGVISTLNSTNVNVTNNLRANHYDLQTVAQLGGSFYVSPTVKFPNSGTTLKVEKSGSTLTLTITDSSITSATMAGVVWTAGSGVKVSGTINGVVTGTMDGTVSSINTSSHTLTLSVSGENSGNVQASPSGNPYNASQFKDLSVMLYTRKQDGTNKMINTASGAIASFTDGGNNVPVKQLVVDIEPVQDLHGQDSPYPAGGGKNYLPLDVSAIKAANTRGSWSGNVYTDSTGFKYTITLDADGNVNGIVVSGTGNNVGVFYIRAYDVPNGSYTINGVPSGASWGSSNTFRIRIGDKTDAYINDCLSNGVTVSTTNGFNLQINVASGYTANNLTFKPMIRLSSVSDATFAPYSNICHISGHDTAVVTRTGKNLLFTNKTTYTLSGVTATKNSDGSWTLNGTCTENNDLDLISGSHISLPSGSYVLSGCPSGGSNTTYVLRTRIINSDGRVYPDDRGSGKSFDMTTGSYIDRVYIEIKNGYKYNNLTFYPMIRPASDTNATFAPYKGNTYTIDLGGTRYGGILDVGTGVMTVTHTYVDENAFGSVSSGTNAGGLHWVDTTTAVFDADKSSYCSMLTRKDGDAGWLSTSPCYSMGADKKVRIYCGESTTALFKSAYADLQIVCGSISPTTVQLSHTEVRTLSGYNNIWSNTGDTNVIYESSQVDSTNNYNVGIWMNCYDQANSSSTIRVYDGSSRWPNVFLGNMTNADLPRVNGNAPYGYGLYSDNVFLRGIISATGGLIGNWTIGTTGMFYNSDAPGSTSITMIPGGTTASTTSIGGSSGSKSWIFTGKNLFGIDTTGKLYASSAEISGKITATSGYFGGSDGTNGWEISTGKIQSTYTFSNATKYMGIGTYGHSWAFYSGASTNGGSDGVFRVGHAGEMYATNAHITGEVTATSGTIGGCSITDGVLQVASANITALDAAKITSGTIAAARIGANSITADKIATNAIIVGTRNLLCFTGTPVEATINTTSFQTFHTYYTPEHVVISDLGAAVGDSLTISFDWETSSQTTYGNFRLEFYGYKSSSETDAYLTIATDTITMSASVKSGHFSKTWTLDATKINTKRIVARVDASNLKIKISHLMMSLSNREVDWTLSPYESGGFNATANKLYSGTIGSDNSVYLSTANMTANIAGRGSTADWRFTVGSHFGVTNTGALYATSGKIANWTINSTYLATGTATAPAENSLILCPNGTQTSYTVAGTAKSGWMITAGTTFGVNKDGGVYAASGKIGPWNVTTTSIYKGENALGSTTSGAAYFGDLGLSVGSKFKVDASGVATLGDPSGYHSTMDADSFDVLKGSTTLATFGEVTRINGGSSDGSSVLIDAGGFSFTNIDGDEMMKISTDNVTIGKYGSSYFYVDSNSIVLRRDNNQDVFKVESGGGDTQTVGYIVGYSSKFTSTQISNGYTITHNDSGTKSSASKVRVIFYKKYAYTAVIDGQTVTKQEYKVNHTLILNTKYYTTSFTENSKVQVKLQSGNSGGVKYINDQVSDYCDSSNPRFEIIIYYSHKTETYSNLNMNGNMTVTGSIASDKIVATTSVTSTDFIYKDTGVSINGVQTASASTTITSSNKIGQTPAIGAQLTLYSGVYLLVANGNFDSGSSSGQRINQIAIYTGTNPTDAQTILSSRVRVINAGSYWSSLSTQIIVTVPSNTGQTFTVGLTSSIAQSAASSTLLQAVYLRPPSS